MKIQSRLIKTTMFFLIVLFHSALTHATFSYTLNSDEHPVGQQDGQPELHLGFDGQLGPSIQQSSQVPVESGLFDQGLIRQSLRVGNNGLSPSAAINLGDTLSLDSNQSFTIQFWIRTTASADRHFVILSKKGAPDNSLRSQKKSGWAFYVFNGTWAWNIGSGNRRLTYERDNGQHMPVNDGRWHQLAMSFDHNTSLVRLYYDGTNWVTYNLRDKDGFDFSSNFPLTIGWKGNGKSTESNLLQIQQGAETLQKLVDQFNALDVGAVEPDDLMNLVINTDRLYQSKLNKLPNAEKPSNKADLDSLKRLVRELSRNPYTVHQVADFMQVAPLLKLYRLKNGKILVNQDKADQFAASERFSNPDFNIDELSIWNRCLTTNHISQHYAAHFRTANLPLERKLGELAAASFNIHHGGKHETIEEDGWDSRETIADLIRREKIDVVMMQETYSSGDFIAAELGYYFATTVDWDYLNQGANISVLSRYPIKEITVPPNSPFMNVAARVTISDTQEIQVMSNWYGMNNFEDVFQFHKKRFENSDNAPILFAGDFNAVPHTDGGKSPASKMLLNAGFRDAYRDSYPNPEEHKGPTHRGGSRIDQLYYKGRGLKHRSTEVLSSWPSLFPSDHYLIKSIFDLDYLTTQED